MTQPTPNVRKARADDAGELARLHSEGLSGGFLASLGSRFLVQLYEAMIVSPDTVVLLAEDEGEVIGFVACAVTPAALWREFLRRHGFRAIWLLAVRLLKPSVRTGVLEVVRHVRQRAERGATLLSIVVGPPARRRGLGFHLVMLLEEELRRRGAHGLEVAVRVDNRWARGFFEHLGFHPLGSLSIHQRYPALRYTKPL